MRRISVGLVVCVDDEDDQTRLAGYARWCDAETRISRLSHIHGCGSEGGHV